jgi:hypothetical protein
MANEARGEVSVVAGSKTYKLKFNSNSIAAVERTLDQSIVAASQRLDWISIRKTMLWGAINAIDSVTRKPINDATFSPDDAGFIMDLVPPDVLLVALVAAVNAAYPKPEKAQDKENP